VRITILKAMLIHILYFKTEPLKNFWVLLFFIRHFPETYRFLVKNYGVSFYRIQV
jgi:hypothetical protein